MKNENALWWLLVGIFLFIGLGIPGWFNIPYWTCLVCHCIGGIGIIESLMQLK